VREEDVSWSSRALPIALYAQHVQKKAKTDPPQIRRLPNVKLRPRCPE